MKQILLVLFTFSMMNVNAITLNLDASYPIIETSSLTVSLTDISQKEFFVNAEFDFVHDNLEFEAKTKIKYIQIIAPDGTLKFQIPVMSKSVFISKKLFKEGIYKLGFKMEGRDKIEFTTVEILR